MKNLQWNGLNPYEEGIEFIRKMEDVGEISIYVCERDIEDHEVLEAVRNE